MIVQQNYRPLGCGECTGGAGLDFDFTMAFQPIVNTTTGEIFAHEALARGLNNEPAAEIFKLVNEQNRYRFDQACRVKAVQLASQLNVGSYISINFMPNAVYRPELCIRTTLEAADKFGFPVERIIFEFTEGEQVLDISHLKDIVHHYQSQGFLTAIDDFGAGYAGLHLLAEVQTDLLKLDMSLIRDIHKDKARRAIAKATIQMCRELSMQVIAEGIESVEELSVLQDLGVELFQGYYFARPAFRALATIPHDLLRRA